jgi:HK97 gp10 family phage protein
VRVELQQNVLSMALEGDKETLDAFNALTGPEKTKARRSAMKKAAKEAVLPSVKSNIKVRTGTLMNAITVIPGGRNFIGAYVGIKDRAAVGVSPEDKHFWPAAVEFGHGDVPAYSYLRKGLDESTGRAKRIIADSLRKWFEKRKKK